MYDGVILSSIGGDSSTIFARSGYVDKDQNNLILYNGNIQRLKEDNTVNIFKFEKTVFDLSGIRTKSISQPKMQETSTFNILNCIKNNNLSESMHNCNQTKKSYMDTKIEINKRLGMPFYIPLISLICSFLLSSRSDQQIYNYRKYIYFLISFLILAVSEGVVRYSGTSWTHTFSYYLIPIVTIPLIYITLLHKFKYENLF